MAKKHGIIHTKISCKRPARRKIMALFEKNTDTPEDSTEEATQSTPLPEFSLEKKGFSRSEVHQYIDGLASRHDEELYALVERLRDTQEEYEQFKEHTESDLSQGEEETNKLKAQNEELRLALEEAVKNADEEVKEELEKQIQELRAENEKLSGELHSGVGSEEVKELQDKIEELQNEKANLLVELQTAKENGEQQVQSVLSDLEARLQQEIQQKEQAETAWKNTEKENEELTQEISHLQSELKSLRDSSESMGEVAKRMTKALEDERLRHEQEMQEEMQRAREEAEKIKASAHKEAELITQEILGNLHGEVERYEVGLNQAQTSRIESEKTLQAGLGNLQREGNELMAGLQNSFDSQINILIQSHNETMSRLANEKQALLDELHSLETQREEVARLLKKDIKKETPSLPESLDPFNGFGDSFPTGDVSPAVEASETAPDDQVSLSDLGKMEAPKPQSSTYSGRFSVNEVESENADIPQTNNDSSTNEADSSSENVEPEPAADNEIVLESPRVFNEED